MAEPSLGSTAEQRALDATRYEGFGVSLPEIKRTVAELLSQIGRNGVFSEFTKHDISHIDEAIRLAEWLVDDQTKKVMTDADWFLITLSIYLHDLGMLVTRDEFLSRDRSSFQDFCSEQLFKGPRADDYKARIDEMAQADRDLFLYQEYVRFNHAKRIRLWIEGSSGVLGVADASVNELQRVLGNLDSTLRRDLGVICESHHLDDLDDLGKYKLTQPYGATDAETANMQYCAIILRSADLLHMRRDRTPSVLFRIINPTDPLSQKEWAKQNAVRRVMARLGLNEDGIPDEKALKDTIEVHARFTEESGFFGLTSFLSYATQEIRKCHEWTEGARKIKGSKYSFVWKRIAEDFIETDGFLKKTYSFDIDQHKILDLLIGHTLYNDTGVVLRELTQNSIDAIRLQQEEDRRAGQPVTNGVVHVDWDSVARILSITDNGTGMTQEIIEKHLLKVGSSRYQDQKFRETNPDFSAISRFGIGVLSTFMVSDEVEITTYSPDEEKARKISLRSVHGRYLVRLLDKTRDREALSLGPHGTQVRLKVRSTAKLGSIPDTLRQWIVLPRCRVTVSVDGGPAEAIGYESTSDAVKNILAEAGMKTEGDAPDYKVITRYASGVELSYAAKWSSYYKDWTFATMPVARNRKWPVPCTCVEGIAVVFATPGMNDLSLIAVANATGVGAPKTNVARSMLEATPERNALYSSVYSMYIQHIKDEIERLKEQEHYSLTWAANNAVTLVPFAFSEGGNIVLPNDLREHMKSLPVYIVEKEGKRVNVSFNSLKEEDTFWTVDCQLVRSAEELVREAKSDSNVAALVTALGDKAQQLPTGTVLYNLDVSSSLRQSVESEFEPQQILSSESFRRVDMEWTARTPSRWLRADELLWRERQQASRGIRIRDYLRERLRRDTREVGRGGYISIEQLWLADETVRFDGASSHSGVSSQFRVFLRGDIPITGFLRNLALLSNDDELALVRFQVFASIFLAVSDLFHHHEQAVTFSTVQLRHVSGDFGEEFVLGSEKFLEALRSSPLERFDTSRWRNRSFYSSGDH